MTQPVTQDEADHEEQRRHVEQVDRPVAGVRHGEGGGFGQDDAG